MISAGPATNLLFAVLLLAVVYMIGIPSAASRRVDAVDPGTPAAHVGLKAGDTIVGVDRIPTRSFSQVRDAIKSSGGHPLVISVLRNLLPLLPLDGGHIAFSLVEGIRGKAVGRAVYERVSMIGIALILFIYVIGLSNDIGNLHGG